MDNGKLNITLENALYNINMFKKNVKIIEYGDNGDSVQLLEFKIYDHDEMISVFDHMANKSELFNRIVRNVSIMDNEDVIFWIDRLTYSIK